MQLSEQEQEYYDSLTRGEKISFTTKKRYSEEERREWRSKGGKVKTKKGFAVSDPKFVKEMAIKAARKRWKYED